MAGQVWNCYGCESWAELTDSKQALADLPPQALERNPPWSQRPCSRRRARIGSNYDRQNQRSKPINHPVSTSCHPAQDPPPKPNVRFGHHAWSRRLHTKCVRPIFTTLHGGGDVRRRDVLGGRGVEVDRVDVDRASQRPVEPTRPQLAIELRANEDKPAADLGSGRDSSWP